MRLLQIFIFALTTFELFFTITAQEFEIPVQLIGFPVIVLAVRLSNFVKKLAYAVNPNTYQQRSKRSALGPREMNVTEVEKKLVAEMGEKVCIYEKVCEEYAKRANRLETENNMLDWENVFSKYEDTPKATKKFYLLSVFLGDIVASPNLCKELAKKGRSCQRNEP